MFWVAITEIWPVVSDEICPAFIAASWSCRKAARSEVVSAEITLLDKEPICCEDSAANRRVVSTLTCDVLSAAICAVVKPLACAAERAAIWSVLRDWIWSVVSAPSWL